MGADPVKPAAKNARGLRAAGWREGCPQAQGAARGRAQRLVRPGHDRAHRLVRGGADDSRCAAWPMARPAPSASPFLDAFAARGWIGRGLRQCLALGVSARPCHARRCGGQRCLNRCFWCWRCLLGSFLGATFFGGLWWTIRKGVSSKVTRALVLGQHPASHGDSGQSASISSGAAIGVGSRAACLGFILARTLATRLTRLPSAERTRTVKAGGA